MVGRVQIISARTLLFVLFAFSHIPPFYAKVKDSSSNSVTDFLDKQWQKLSDKGVSCPLKTLTLRNIDQQRLINQDKKSIMCMIEALQDQKTQTNGVLWTVLGSLFASNGKKTEAVTSFKLASRLIGKFSEVTEWAVIGPFVIGKMELDGDPLEAFGGIRNVSIHRFHKSTVLYSEALPNGVVKWMSFKPKSNSEMMQVSFDVNWNDLVNSLSSIGILEWQGWAVGEFAVTEKNHNVVIQCLGVHTVYVDDSPLTGDVYQRDQFWYAMKLSQGIHTMYVKLRAKVTANFRCSIKVQTDDFKILKPPFLPDLYDGHLFGQYLTVPIANYHHTDFLKLIKISVQQQSIGGNLDVQLLSKSSVAPGQIYLAIIKLTTGSDNVIQQCSDIDITLKITTSKGSMTLPLTLRCRTAKQSVLFTFLDHDGSVQHAAAIHPVHDCYQGLCPTLLTLHGTTVPPQNQADSYKRMENGEFVFGVDYCWLLAPTRHGAHNWEGPGALTALAALDNLAVLTQEAQWIKSTADPNHVIYAGHSMGGHGAWHLATHYPDRALAVVSLAGWIKKEEYGDSNLFFRHDTSTSHVDPAIKAVMEACIVENDADKHVTNLKGVPVYIRIGASDRTVHPFFPRRMFRLLREVRADVNYTELAGKEHWWWDTSDTNDGGVVNDLQLRDFMNKYAADHLQTGGQCDGDSCSDDPSVTNRYTLDLGEMSRSFRLTCYNPALGESMHGIRILQQVTPYRLSQIQGDLKDQKLMLKTVNVFRFSLTHPPNRKILHGSVEVEVDAQSVMKSTETLKGQVLQFCKVQGMWRECQSDIDTDLARGPLTLGPARRIAEQPFVIVIGTQNDHSSYIQEAAVYISNLFFLTSDTKTTIIRDTETTLTELRDQNVILIGGPGENMYTATFLDALPLTYSDGTFTLGSCSFSDQRTGVLSLVPNGNGHLGLVLMGNSLTALQDIVSLATPTIPPMTRSPFSNLVPDFVVTGPEFGWKGPGGYLCAGFWGNAWEYRPDLTSCSCLL